VEVVVAMIVDGKHSIFDEHVEVILMMVTMIIVVVMEYVHLLHLLMVLLDDHEHVLPIHHPRWRLGWIVVLLHLKFDSCWYWSLGHLLLLDPLALVAGEQHHATFNYSNQ
jgi:hypothetical protein